MGFNELQSILSLACKFWPLRVPASKHFGGGFKFLFKLDLKDCKESACYISTGRFFQVLMVDDKKELKLRFVFACRSSIYWNF